MDNRSVTGTTSLSSSVRNTPSKARHASELARVAEHPGSKRDEAFYQLFEVSRSKNSQGSHRSPIASSPDPQAPQKCTRCSWDCELSSTVVVPIVPVSFFCTDIDSVLISTAVLKTSEAGFPDLHELLLPGDAMEFDISTTRRQKR